MQTRGVPKTKTTEKLKTENCVFFRLKAEPKTEKNYDFGLVYFFHRNCITMCVKCNNIYIKLKLSFCSFQ